MVKTMETETILGGSKITADGDCSHEIKRCLLLGRKVMTNLDSILKNQICYFANKGPFIQGYGFSCGHIWMWELNCEESWAPKNWCFWTVVLEKTLEAQRPPSMISGNGSCARLFRDSAENRSIPPSWTRISGRTSSRCPVRTRRCGSWSRTAMKSTSSQPLCIRPFRKRWTRCSSATSPTSAGTTSLSRTTSIWSAETCLWTTGRTISAAAITGKSSLRLRTTGILMNPPSELCVRGTGKKFTTWSPPWRKLLNKSLIYQNSCLLPSGSCFGFVLNKKKLWQKWHYSLSVVLSLLSLEFMNYMITIRIFFDSSARIWYIFIKRNCFCRVKEGVLYEVCIAKLYYYHIDHFLSAVHDVIFAKQ